MTSLWKQMTRIPGVGKCLPFCLVITAQLSAQQAELKPEKGSGCVWKLSDGDNTVYLAGSVHLLREGDYPLPTAYDLAYADSAEVVFEIDMADLTGRDGAKEMLSAGSYPADDSLKNHLTKKAFDRIVDYFNSRSAVPAGGQKTVPAIERFKPGLIFLMISSIEAQELGARPELGLEMQYFKRAIRDEKPTGGLETIAYQMSRFDEFAPEEIEALIIKTLDELDEMPRVLDELISNWRKGDLVALDTLLNEQMEDEIPVREHLLIRRNKNWIPEIEKALEGSESVLFIVGAAHLIGEGSVIDLLRKKGYRVDRVEAEEVEQKKAA